MCQDVVGREANREEGQPGKGMVAKQSKGKDRISKPKRTVKAKKTVTVKHLSWSLFLKLTNKKNKGRRRRGLDSRVTRLDQEGVGSRPV
jgi:hypothetical protein